MNRTEIIEKTSGANVKGADQNITGDSLSKGIKYDFSPWLLIEYYKVDPIIRAAVVKKCTKVMAGGWSIEPILDKPDAETQTGEEAKEDIDSEEKDLAKVDVEIKEKTDTEDTAAGKAEDKEKDGSGE